MRSQRLCLLCAGLLSVLWSCGTTPAPRQRVESKGGFPDARAREELRSEAQVQAPVQDPKQAAPPAANDGPDMAIALVSGEPIDVRSFLARTWIRSSDMSREILDRLVVERLALLEAERQEIAVSQTRVDERLEVAWKALGDSVARKGGGVSVAEHLRRELGVDSEYYRRQLRREAIAQLVAERVVRLWASGRERCEVTLVDLADQATADAFSAGLAAGRDFDSLAQEHHFFKDKEPRGTRIKLIRNENAELSRLAFNTSVGQVAGPIKAEAGRQLILRVETRLPPLTGEWKALAPAIEKSLAEEPVNDFEYLQWRAEMGKIYSVDLEPFFRLIGVAR